MHNYIYVPGKVDCYELCSQFWLGLLHLTPIAIAGPLLLRVRLERWLLNVLLQSIAYFHKYGDDELKKDIFGLGFALTT